MRIGIPKEIKDGEARVGATPGMVQVLAESGHHVLIEAGAGSRSGFNNEDYHRAGAHLVDTPEEIFACPLIVKVKELQNAEYLRLKAGSIVAGYQQLARDPDLLEAVLSAGITCLAYEGVTQADGQRPMLTPMSTIAGLMSAQIAAWALQRRDGPLSGSGVLLPGLDGVPPANVLILGDGVAGSASAKAFLGQGCHVTVLGMEAIKLEQLASRLKGTRCGSLETELSTVEALTKRIAEADVVIGAIAIPGRLTPKLITRAMLRRMRPGSVLIDIGIDMGGVAETSRQTELSDPLYVEEGILHYCVPNIPAQVPRAATLALVSATLPFIKEIADLGLDDALRRRPELRAGLLVHEGRVVNPALAEECHRPYTPYSLHDD